MHAYRLKSTGSHTRSHGMKTAGHTSIVSLETTTLQDAGACYSGEVVCMYVCMYACMCACMHVCMHVCVYVCMYVCMYACMCVCMHVCVYGVSEEHSWTYQYCFSRNDDAAGCWRLFFSRSEYMYVCMYVWIYVCIPVHIQPFTHLHLWLKTTFMVENIFLYTCMYIYGWAHSCIYRRTCIQKIPTLTKSWRLHIHTTIHAHTLTYINTYIDTCPEMSPNHGGYIQIHTSIHTYIHTYSTRNVSTSRRAVAARYSMRLHTNTHILLTYIHNTIRNVTTSRRAVVAWCWRRRRPRPCVCFDVDGLDGAIRWRDGRGSHPRYAVCMYVYVRVYTYILTDWLREYYIHKSILWVYCVKHTYMYKIYDQKFHL
jgi:hypothetical protein